MINAEEILTRFRTAEKEAFQLLYDAWYESLVLFSNHIVADAEAAEDIVQECFVKFWQTKRWQTLESGLDKYMFQSVKFSSFNYRRGDRRKKTLHEQAYKEQTEENTRIPETEEVEILAKIWSVINRLPDERREIFLLVFVEGKSYQKVADRFGISKNTVKTQLSRSLQFLRKELKDRYNSFLLFFLLKKSL